MPLLASTPVKAEPVNWEPWTPFYCQAAMRAWLISLSRFAMSVNTSRAR